MGNKNSGLKHFDIPFDDSNESMYWLGYICADGTIQSNTNYRVYSVRLFSMDKDPIEKFIKFVGDRCKYHFRKECSLHTANINSRQLVEYFGNIYNIKPKKAHNLNPYIVLNRDFIRGYFDGDGSIRKGRKECKITSSSKVFIDRLTNHFDNLNIYYKVRQKGNAYDICIERAKECKKLLDYLYKDCEIYLDRKYKQYVALFGDK